MTAPLTLAQALDDLNPAPRLVVLMCGVAGSGKTSFSRALEAKGFRRLSIDEEIWDRFGRYGVDYRPEDYDRHVAAARAALRDQLTARLAAGRDAVVVDSSFWSRAHRYDFKHLVEAAGGTWRLIYLDAPETILRERLAARSTRFDANAALPIDETKLRGFLASFEAPSGESEITVAVS